MAPCPQMSRELKNRLTFLGSLYATILSFADPISDILTVVEYYRADHITWFAVGLAFIFLPCVLFLVLMWGRAGSCAERCLCGFNPFSSAWVNLKMCWKNFKKCCACCEDQDNSEDTDEDDEVLDDHCKLARFHEAVLESAPQFILQLYAVNVQQEPVKIIQMISLAASFLSLVWAFRAADELGLDPVVLENVTHQVFCFSTHLFLLSSRLVAIAFFTVACKWWIISVFTIHSVSFVAVDTCWAYTKSHRFSWPMEMGNIPFRFCLLWLRDDESPLILFCDVTDKESTEQRKRMVLFCNVLFLIENCIMILLVYFTPSSNTWYSLPVTVCVCSFSVIGAIARVVHYNCFLTKEKNRDVNSPAQKNNNNAWASI